MIHVLERLGGNLAGGKGVGDETKLKVEALRKPLEASRTTAAGSGDAKRPRLGLGAVVCERMAGENRDASRP